jgi:CheY-like chemotaxis protein
VFDLILIVDDHLIDVFVTSKIIQASNLSKEVLEYNSPVKAMEYLQKNENDPRWIPDLILLDINMPLKDGFKFMDEFARLGENVRKKAKVVILSSSVDPEEIKRAEKQEYVFRFLSKPLTVEKLSSLK